NLYIFYFYNETSTTYINTLSLHDALPISNLASMLPLESLIYISDYNDNKIQHGKDEVYAQIVSTLGILPDNIDKSKKAILLVEGKEDIVLVRHLCNKLKEENAIPYTLQEKDFTQ